MRMSKQYPHVFQPLKVGPVTLKNRIQFSPMVCCLSNAAGEVTAEYRDFLAMQARTGDVYKRQHRYRPRDRRRLLR